MQTCCLGYSIDNFIVGRGACYLLWLLTDLDVDQRPLRLYNDVPILHGASRFLLEGVLYNSFEASWKVRACLVKHNV